MAFEYPWLKILQVLATAKRPMGPDELRAGLARFGFQFEGTRLEDAIGRLQEQELVEVLVYAGGESVGSVAITAKGERKLRGIVRF
jgi:repressor of nif and glnA expression